MSDGEARSGVTTEHNPAYGLSGRQRRETNDEYDAVPQETVYEGGF